MREFMILFKHELKMLFPSIVVGKKKKYDIFGFVLSLLITLFIASVFIMLVARIAKGYVDVRVDKIIDPSKRAVELLNVLYLFVIVLMVIGCTRKMSGVLAERKNKEIYLRLPVKHQNLFLSKLIALMIWTLMLGFSLILPINIIIYLVLKPTFVFWLKTVFTLVAIPMIVFGISTILLIPYIKIVDFLKNKYLWIFIILSGALIGTFLLYSQFLEIIQLLLETGSIKFLFNKGFVTTLQTMLKWAYPSNCFAHVMIGDKFILPLITILLFVGLSIALTYFVSNKLFNVTLYKSEQERKVGKPKTDYHQNKPMVSLIKKEFVNVYRNPKHLFSYFTIALAMPVMVYCCYTLFDSLITNSFGIEITFSLALLVLLMFSVLTNTFCATNITRDGVSFLKIKSLPLKPTHIMLSKVLFCGIVSTLSIIASIAVLVAFTGVTIVDGLLCSLIVIVFSYSQILIATRLDLNHTRFLSTTVEAETTSSKTITKVVVLGLVLALLMGIVSLLIYIMSQGSALQFVQNLHLRKIYSYIWPAIISVLYLLYAIIYYNYKVNKSFDALVG